MTPAAPGPDRPAGAPPARPRSGSGPASPSGADPRTDWHAEDFGLEYTELTGMAASRLQGVLRAGYRVLGADGAVDPGALLGAADIVGGVASGLSVMPAWVVTTTMAARIDRARAAGPLGVTATVLRSGDRSAVSLVRFTDGEDPQAGPVLAEVAVTSAVRRPDGLDLGFARPLHRRLTRPPSTAATADAYALHAVDDRTVRLELQPHLRNPWGILHGGAMSVLLDRAARHAALAGAEPGDRVLADPGDRFPAGPGHRVPAGPGPARPVSAEDGSGSRSFVLHFLAPTVVGPAEARCTLLGSGPAGTVVRVSVHDTGAADAQVALAAVVVA